MRTRRVAGGCVSSALTKAAQFSCVLRHALIAAAVGSLHCHTDLRGPTAAMEQDSSLPDNDGGLDGGGPATDDGLPEAGPDGHVCMMDSGTPATCAQDADECATRLDDCDRDPEACVNTLGSYKCRCPPYFTGSGRGPDGCQDMLECEADNGGCDDSPMAECIEVVGGPPSCTCPLGYVGGGEGEEGCVDLDECTDSPIAVCGAGATSCTNRPGTWECTCATSHRLAVDATVCEPRTWSAPVQLDNDLWTDGFHPSIAANAAGDAIIVWRQWREIQSTRYPAVGGWSGDIVRISLGGVDTTGDPKVAIDAAGNAAALWLETDGTRDSVWTNRYVAGSGWSGAHVLDVDDIGAARSPSVTMNADGDAMATWEQWDGTRYNLWASRYVVDSGWETPDLLELVDDPAMSSSVAMDTSGNAIVVWLQGEFHVRAWARRYVAGDGWSDVIPLDEDDRGIAMQGPPRVAMDADGNAVVVWTEFDSLSSTRTWARRYELGAGWHPAELISALGSEASNANVAVSLSGDAFAVWQQQERMTDDMLGLMSLWASRHTNGEWGMPELLESYTLANAFDPVVAMDASGNGVVVWCQNDQDNGNFVNNVWSNRYVVGVGWGIERRLDTYHVLSTTSSTVAMRPSGSAIAVWDQSDSERNHVWASVLE